MKEAQENILSNTFTQELTRVKTLSDCIKQLITDAATYAESETQQLKLHGIEL